jgi:hypothetical protein
VPLFVLLRLPRRRVRGQGWSVMRGDGPEVRFRAKFYWRNGPENFTCYTVEFTALV